MKNIWLLDIPCRPLPKPSTRSIGVDAVASCELGSDPVPPWESPVFPKSQLTGPNIWQELCVQAESSVTALLSANAAESFDALLFLNAEAVPSGLLSALQAKVAISDTANGLHLVSNS